MKATLTGKSLGWLIIGLLFLQYGILSGETYYISTAGSDFFPGTLDSTWANLSYAITVASAGDTILLRGGTYETNEVWIQGGYGMGGEEGHYLTIKNFPGEKVSIGGIRRVIIQADYVRIEGLHFRLPYNLSAAGEGLQIVNNTFEGIQPEVAAIEFTSNNGLIEGNKIIISGGGTSVDHGIYVGAGANYIIRNNFISGTAGYSLHLYSKLSAGYENILIEQNVLTNSRLRSGMIIAPDFGIEAKEIVIRQNIFSNNIQHGLWLRYSTQNVEIYNNTFFGNGSGSNSDFSWSAISIQDAAVQNVDFKNNIIEMSHDNAYHIENQGGALNITAERNLYWGTGTSRLKDVIDTSPLFGDPWFADASNNDFHIASLSPAVDAGLDTNLPFLGDAIDLGALEFGIPDIVVQPAYHDFGKVEVNMTASGSVQITNTGSEELQIRDIFLLGPDSDDFLIESENFPISLYSGTNHDVQVNFDPKSVGEKKAILKITFAGSSVDSLLNIALTGLGDPGDVADLGLSTTDCAFGDVEVGVKSSRAIEIANIGKADLQVQTISLSGADTSQFSFDKHDTPFSLSPGENQNITINFTPNNEGQKNANLLLQSNDWNDSLSVIRLSGNGIPIKKPHISISSTSHDFGSIEVGQSVFYTFQVMNSGEKVLQCYSTNLLGTDSTEFLIDQGSSGFILDPGKQHDLIVSFKPSAPGTKSATLRLASNDLDNPMLDISLIGYGFSATEIEDKLALIPKSFLLRQNYPNPFNPQTIIEYEIPKSSFVSIKIYNIQGKLLAELVNAHKTPGIYKATWRGLNSAGNDVSSGPYFYQIMALSEKGNKELFSDTKLMMLVR